MNKQNQSPNANPSSNKKKALFFPKGRNLSAKDCDLVQGIIGEKPYKRDMLIEYLHAIQDKDTGPEAHQNSRFSSIIIKEHSYIRGNDIYLYAYFDNENSVNRYFDLINFISTSIS